jgi:hypothetical protein
LTIGTLPFKFRMSYIPYLIALITKLAKTDAFHKRTANFLFNRLTAHRTLSSIYFDPGGVCLLRIDNIAPALKVEASSWGMWFSFAAKTIKLSTGTVHYRKFHHCWLRTKVRTVFIRAKTDIFILNRIVYTYLFTIKFF